MPRYRLLTLTALILTVLTLAFAASPTEGHELHARVTSDWKAVQVRDANGELVTRFTIRKWRRWAQENFAALPFTPIEVAGQELGAERFDIISAASVSPDGERVIVAVNTYVVATTITVVGLLDLEERSFRVVDELVWGDPAEITWEPNGRLVAYTVGTARANGDGLRVDDTHGHSVVASLDGEALLAELQGSKLLGGDAPPEFWIPQMRDPEWLDESTLSFASNHPTDEGEIIQWILRLENDGAGKLEVEGG